MADETVTVGTGSDEVAEASAVSTTGPVGLAEARAARAAKIVEARQGLRKMAAAEPAATEPSEPAAPAIPPAQREEAPAAAPVEDRPDPATAKGIEAVEKNAKRQRDAIAAERASAKAELDAERAELARMRAEMTGKVTPFEELQKLAKTPGKTLELLKRLGVESDDDFERYARDTYAVSKSGKADPKNKAHADQMAEKQGLAAELAELRKIVDETRAHVSTREQQAHAERFQQQYLDEAVKALPADPTFIGLAHSANPAKARTAILALGQRMEREAMEADGATKYDASYTPSHAEVIARYEQERKQDLKDGGFTDEQIANMLAKKPAVAAATKKPATTLDVTRGPITQTLNGTGNPTRDQKVAAARAGRLKLNAEAI